MIKPFVIRQTRDEYLISPDSGTFDASIERRIQFVQGANTFIAAMLAYDSIERGYQLFQFYSSCSSYSLNIGALLIGNFFWISCCIFGFLSIDAKSSQKIHRYYIALLCVLFTRLIVYGIMAYKMNSSDLNNVVCQSLNQTGLIIIQIVIESTILLIMILFSHSIRYYVRQWELAEDRKQWAYNK